MLLTTQLVLTLSLSSATSPKHPAYRTQQRAISAVRNAKVAKLLFGQGSGSMLELDGTVDPFLRAQRHTKPKWSAVTEEPLVIRRIMSQETLATLLANKDDLERTLEEVREVRVLWSRLNCARQVLGDIGKYDDLKSTIGALQRELVQQQLKARALEDELKKPINVHR